MRADAWQALFAGGTFATAVSASFIGLAQLSEYNKERREQTRPYIVVDFFFRQTELCVVAQNVGRTPATNVIIQFDRELQSSHPDIAKEANDAIARPIPMMAPGRRIVWLLDSAVTAFDGEKDRHTYKVRVKYSDLAPTKRWFPLRRRGKITEYRDPEQVLDLQQYRGSLFDESTMWDLVAAVKALKRR